MQFEERSFQTQFSVFADKLCEQNIDGLSDYLINLRCPIMSDQRWYQDVFISKMMLRKDCHKPYWKEKFIDDLPPIFAHKVKREIMGKNDSIDYDHLTYGDILSTIKKLGINM